MRTRSLKVIDMAVHKVAVITPEKSIQESARQMRVEHVGSLVVVDQDGKPIGMLTDRDITIEGVARGVDVDQTTVRDLMTAPVVTATESEGMVTALARMREFGIRRLPIIDSEGKLVGVVTNSNLIKELSELLDGLVRNISSSKTREVALRSDI
ncbi:CBS domain-containing protein [Sutterella wadsworthensis]|uniref:CBS domain-containing protein n=1 Tax=Sutterella wadsworthensis TaxID=40545 RepID=UPI003AB92F68